MLQLLREEEKEGKVQMRWLPSQNSLDFLFKEVNR